MDGATLEALSREIFAGDTHGWHRREFETLLADPGGVAIATPLGFALARITADEAELYLIGVLPQARRQGAASRLLEALEAELTQRGARRLFLEVAASNAPARAFYGARGFSEVGARRGYYGTGQDAVILEKAFNS